MLQYRNRIGIPLVSQWKSLKASFFNILKLLQGMWQLLTLKLAKIMDSFDILLNIILFFPSVYPAWARVKALNIRFKCTIFKLVAIPTISACFKEIMSCLLSLLKRKTSRVCFYFLGGVYDYIVSFCILQSYKNKTSPNMYNDIPVDR